MDSKKLSSSSFFGIDRRRYTAAANMRVLVVLCALAGYVAAEAGYHYNAPQSSYGVPTLGYSSGSSGHGVQVVQSVPSVSHSYQAASSAPSGFQSGGLYLGSSTGGYQGVSSGGYQGVSTGGYQGYSSGGFQGVGNGFQSAGNGFGASSIASSAYHGSSGQSAAVVQQQGPAQVFKHFYVHSAPEEPEQAQVKQSLVLPPPQKHYKVIFIKTPTVQSSSTQFVPVPTQNEEKTLVYVLSNKAEQAQNVVVPKFEPKPPSKPEVFFIKYNNKEDSHSVINNIVNDFNAKQPGLVSFSGLDGGESGGAVVSSGGSSGFGGGSSSGFGNGGSSGGFGGSQEVSSGVVNVASVADTGSFNGGSGSSGVDLNSVSFASNAGGLESQGSFSAGGFNGGQAATVNSFTSQSAPHASYGIPSFRAH